MALCGSDLCYQHTLTGRKVQPVTITPHEHLFEDHIRWVTRFIDVPLVPIVQALRKSQDLVYLCLHCTF